MVVLSLYPPYSTIVGKKEVEVDLGFGAGHEASSGEASSGEAGSGEAGSGEAGPREADPVPAGEFFTRFCEGYPALRELFFPTGSTQDFPGYTLVLRGGVPLRSADAVRPGDVLEVLTALTGG